HSPCGSGASVTIWFEPWKGWATRGLHERFFDADRLVDHDQITGERSIHNSVIPAHPPIHLTDFLIIYPYWPTVASGLRRYRIHISQACVDSPSAARSAG